MLHKSPDRSGETERSDFLMPFWPAWSMDVWHPMLSDTMGRNGKVGATIAALNGEWLDFVNRRLKDDFALPQQLASCHDPIEMWRVYAEFFRKLVDDYQKEFAELARLGSAAAAEGASAQPCGSSRKKPAAKDGARLPLEL